MYIKLHFAFRKISRIRGITPTYYQSPTGQVISPHYIVEISFTFAIPDVPRQAWCGKNKIKNSLFIYKIN